ncbi:hypothetical protein, partial [Phenylobacterium sp.]|uniref:hypothetical protein n=1 Tax=Phenylobacterium sp. TaxID=1871053 RepID=UPI0035AFBF32
PPTDHDDNGRLPDPGTVAATGADPGLASPGSASGSTTLHHFKQTIPVSAQPKTGTYAHLLSKT